MIWKLFERFAFDSIRAGREQYAVDAIVQRIRWHVDVDTRGDEVKINNDFRASSARMFMAAHSEHAGFFSLRRRTSAEKPPFAIDMPVYNTGPIGDERTLMEQLRRMAGA
jgi:hypothetical protein